MSRVVRTLILMLVDTILICSSIYLAYLLRFDFDIKPVYADKIPYVMILTAILVLNSLYYFKVYRKLWQYASIGDLISIIKGVNVGSILFFTIHHLGVLYYYPELVVPRSIYALSALIMMLSIGGSRFVWRILHDNYIKIQPHHRRTLIVGAGSAGTMIVKELKHSNSEYYPVAFIDDDANKTTLEVLGVPIVGNRMDIPKIVEKYHIQDIIIALPSLSKAETAEILAICKETHCMIKIIPKMKDLINGKVAIKKIRDVGVEDLLGRDPVKVDLVEMSNYLSGHTVLVTGAGGSIGSELCLQLATFSPKKLILLGHGENSIYEIELELRNKFPDLQIEAVIADIQDKYRLNQVFDIQRPEVVFHAAAHKHVPLMEHNPIEAIKNNVIGTKNVAECSHEYKSLRFVMISTDKAVNPTNVMGACKRIAEMIVQSLDKISETQFAAVRFGNVLGSRGSVIPIFKKQIEQGGPVTVTHPDMIRYFMTIPEAVQLVIQTGALARGGEIFILDMGNPVKISDLAKDLIQLSGFEPGKDIKVEYTGIRPGEKLFEEILTREEGAVATKHNRIYVGQASGMSYDEVINNVRKLEHLMKLSPSVAEVKQVLKEVVPTYQCNEQIGVQAVKESVRASLEMVATIGTK
ncbi:FlaA1/EpsC-like NDP-sugar epimerase [Paenibacillus sp. V4I3]|uniref:polysaccharide biosynthesis protein n=1 Tax=Paenibacillus sp. V4I3 TaxID=3042305 RepID=UPI00278B1E28|nr:nucleoside-diphosphate sugar epimerase/dehydratase [Paenibacillus sp. V4I3]MDQ0873148.1 FlaA1/EpsC-like NDP-sugar epimerase [Paenibacillus sp. V4I3]